jgi:RNA polymerase sigma-70 factor (ECF subfamily)
MKNLASLSDNELICEVKDGNSDAFQTLVYRHDSKVLSIAARYTNNAEEAKDIYQEVFIRAYRGLGGFRKQSEFTTWLYRITTNVCIASYRNRKKSYGIITQHENIGNGTVDPLQVERNNNTPHEQMMNTEISARVANAVKLLSPRQKIIFTLRHYEGFKLSEIAKFLKCTEGAVKKQLFTAIRKLREDLKDLYFEGLS